MKRTGVLVLVGALLSSGCASQHLSHLGQYKEQFGSYHAAYSRKGDLLVSYQAKLSDVTGDLRKDMASTHPAERWASVSVDTLSKCPTGGFTNGIPFIIHREAMPSDVQNNAHEVPVIHATVNGNYWPPRVQAPDTVRVVVPVAIVIQSGGLYGAGASMGIRVLRSDGVSVWVPGSVPDVLGRDGWAYPIMIIGFPPAIVFDIVTSPIQLFMGIGSYFKSITG